MSEPCYNLAMIFISKSLPNQLYGMFIVPCYYDFIFNIAILTTLFIKFNHFPTYFGNKTYTSSSNTFTSLFSKVHDINIYSYNLTIVNLWR